MAKEQNHDLRILAVDDDRSILDLYSMILNPDIALQGGDPSPLPPLDLLLSERGDQAVQMLKESMEEGKPVVMAFLDMLMPGGPDGLWTAERIRELDPSVAIVIVTGHEIANSSEFSLRVPPADKLLYLRKPFHFEEIRQITLALHAKWKAERQSQKTQEELEILVKQRTSDLSATNQKLTAEIQQRLEIEEALRRNEQNFRNIIYSNADAMLILDDRGIIRFGNPAAGKLFSRRESELVGDVFGFPLETGTRTELEIPRKDGSSSIAEMYVVETEWEQNTARLVSLRDISDRKEMEEQIRQNYAALTRAMKGTIQAMARTVEMKDPYTAGHQGRVAHMAMAMARNMGLSQERVETIYMAGMIHDLGKISVPSTILVKPTPLTNLEFALIKQHPQIGFDILKGIEFPWEIGEIILQHHERLDGSGYPRKLKAEEIMLEARIISVADVVEAMASDRPYRPARGIESAFQEISTRKGTVYDEDAVEACLRVVSDNGKDLRWANEPSPEI